MAENRFITRWRVAASQQVTWDVLNDVLRYPDWWDCYRHCQILTPGVVGVGSGSEYRLRGALSYDVHYRISVTHSDPPREARFLATGDLAGDGRMVYEPDGDGTLVTIYWNVRTTGFWLNLMAPLRKGLFAWDHHVMRKGERGLERWLRERNGGKRVGSGVT